MDRKNRRGQSFIELLFLTLFLAIVLLFIEKYNLLLWRKYESYKIQRKNFFYQK